MPREGFTAWKLQPQRIEGSFAFIFMFSEIKKFNEARRIDKNKFSETSFGRATTKFLTLAKADRFSGGGKP